MRGARWQRDEVRRADAAMIAALDEQLGAQALAHRGKLKRRTGPAASPAVRRSGHAQLEINEVPSATTASFSLAPASSLFAAEVEVAR
jgi:hypothetical protein